jgi:hypothetical protein
LSQLLALGLVKNVHPLVRKRVPNAVDHMRLSFATLAHTDLQRGAAVAHHGASLSNGR